MDQVGARTLLQKAMITSYQQRIMPTTFNKSLFRQVQSDSRKNKDIRETEKLIRKRMRELPRDTELFIVESHDGMFNGVYSPGTKVKKISMAKHYMCVKLPDGLITEMHYKQLGTDEIQVTRKLLE